MNYYVDVDDTLVRTAGTKRVPIPTTIAWIKSAALAGHGIYLWSRGGAAYAQTVASSLGIERSITLCLPKPDFIIDDQSVAEWSHLKYIHPNEL